MLHKKHVSDNKKKEEELIKSQQRTIDKFVVKCLNLLVT
jgi:hypothetical protein